MRMVDMQRAHPFVKQRGVSYLHRSRLNSLKRRSSFQLRLPFCTWSSNCANAPSWTVKPMIATVK